MEVNNNIFNTNKIAMQQEVAMHREDYSSSAALFESKEVFEDKFIKFSNKVDKEMADNIINKYQGAFEKMNQKILNTQEIKSLSAYLEIVADYIKLSI